MIKAKWVGTAAIALKIMHLKPLVRRAIQHRLEGEADKLVKDMQRSAPIDRGNLRDSIRREPGENYPGVTVMAGGTPETTKTGRYTVDEAVMVEFGTSKTKAQPFFYPAINKRRKKIKKDIVDAADGAAED